MISTIDGSTGAVTVNREALFTKINEEKVDLSEAATAARTGRRARTAR